ncbi:MAG: threonine-phosphate decarboxylase CobD [Candidatus Omnitrophica bacterium]|nr:threonine-phosphate decarboxylase CobD [Candidatus Omnitrophota bacterium]
MKFIPGALAHGGDLKWASRAFGIREKDIVDFSSNVNARPVPAAVVKAVGKSLSGIARYPDVRCSKLLGALSGRLGVEEGHIAAGNGSAEIIHRLVRAFCIKSAVVIMPAFGEYSKALLEAGARVRPFFTRERNRFVPDIKEIAENIPSCADALFFCNPNNPTGVLTPKEDIESLAAVLRRKKTILVLDEAFIDLEEEESLVKSAPGAGNLLVLRSMTKFFGLAGLRLGYAVGSLAMIKSLRDFGQPWPVNVFAQAAGEAVLKERSFCVLSRREIIEERDFLYERLIMARGVRPFPSRANFIMLKIENGISSGMLQRLLAKRGLLIRDCADFPGLSDKYCRIAVRGRADNLRLLRELDIILRQG